MKPYQYTKPFRPERAYYAFMAALLFGWGATATGYPVFQRSIHLSNAQIFLVEVVFNLVLFSAEIPTGLFADGKGRAFSVGIGAALVTVGTILIGLAQGFWSVLPGFVALGFAEAFMSGALQAWTKDALIAKKRGNEYPLVLSRGGMIGGIAMWLGGIVGATTLSASTRIQWFISAFCAGFMTWIVIRYMAGRGKPVRSIPEREAWSHAWGALRRSTALQWAVLAGMVFPFFWVAHLQWQPKAYNASGMNELFLGWTAVCVGVTVGSWIQGHVIEKPVGILVSLGVMGLALLFLSSSDVAGIPVYMFALWLGRGWFEQSVDTFVQARVMDSYRATFGSLRSLLNRVVTAFIFLAMSWRSLGLTYETAVNSVFLVSGICMLAGTALLFFLMRWASTPALRMDKLISAAPLPSPARDD